MSNKFEIQPIGRFVGTSAAVKRPRVRPDKFQIELLEAEKRCEYWKRSGMRECLMTIVGRYSETEKQKIK